MNDWKALLYLMYPEELTTPVWSVIKENFHNAVWTVEEQTLYASMFCSPPLLMWYATLSIALFSPQLFKIVFSKLVEHVTNGSVAGCKS